MAHLVYGARRDNPDEIFSFFQCFRIMTGMFGNLSLVLALCIRVDSLMKRCRAKFTSVICAKYLAHFKMGCKDLVLEAEHQIPMASHAITPLPCTMYHAMPLYLVYHGIICQASLINIHSDHPLIPLSHHPYTDRVTRKKWSFHSFITAVFHHLNYLIHYLFVTCVRKGRTK